MYTFDPNIAIAGLAVGVLVGLTGMGGQCWGAVRLWPVEHSNSWQMVGMHPEARSLRAVMPEAGLANDMSAPVASQHRFAITVVVAECRHR